MSHCHTLIASLRQRGYRMTPQREIIIEALAHAGGHVTAEEIYTQAYQRVQAINIATVYRTLDLLVATGLASRADLWDGRVVYTTFEHGQHIHLVCKHCGAVLKAEHDLIAPLYKLLEAEYQFHADLEHLSIFGVCADCQSRSMKARDKEKGG
jgi:Fur family transcriptional regulator, ferric uptake regulator